MSTSPQDTIGPEDIAAMRLPIAQGPKSELLTPAAFILIGVIALTGMYLSPLMLEMLLTEGRLSAAEIGRAATAEMLAAGVASMAAGAWLRPVRLRLWAVLLGLALVLAQAATTEATHGGVVIARSMAGVTEGLLMWLPMSMISRSPHAGRLVGVFATVTSAIPALVAMALPFLGSEGHRANSAYVVLAGMALFTIALSPFLPSALPPIAAETQEQSTSRFAGWAVFALAGAFLVQLAAGAQWAYLGPIATEAGVSPQLLGAAISCGLIAQVLAGLIASAFADRLPVFPMVLGSTLPMACSAVGLALLAHGGFFILAVAAGSFGSLLVQPFQMLMAIRLDPSRRAAMLLTGTQMVGGSVGPILASLFVSGSSSRGALAVAMASLLLNFALMAPIALRARVQRA